MISSYRSTRFITNRKDIKSVEFSNSFPEFNSLKRWVKVQADCSCGHYSDFFFGRDERYLKISAEEYTCICGKQFETGRIISCSVDKFERKTKGYLQYD